MCQGLPCVGAKVELIATVVTPEKREILRGTRGTIKAEHPAEREVTVEFPEAKLTARVSERALKAL